MKAKRKAFFGVMYLLFGIVMLSFASAPRGLNWFALPLAILFFVASAGAFVGAGRWWWILHVTLSAVVLFAWFEAWEYALPFMLGKRHAVDWGGLGVLFVLTAGVILTFAVIAYAIDLVGWVRQGAGATSSGAPSQEQRINDVGH